MLFGLRGACVAALFGGFVWAQTGVALEETSSGEVSCASEGESNKRRTDLRRKAEGADLGPADERPWSGLLPNVTLEVWGGWREADSTRSWSPNVQVTRWPRGWAKWTVWLVWDLAAAVGLDDQGSDRAIEEERRRRQHLATISAKAYRDYAIARWRMATPATVAQTAQTMLDQERARSLLHALQECEVSQ